MQQSVDLGTWTFLKYLHQESSSPCIQRSSTDKLRAHDNRPREGQHHHWMLDMHAYLLSWLVGGSPYADYRDLWEVVSVKACGRGLIAVDIPEPESNVRSSFCLHTSHYRHGWATRQERFGVIDQDYWRPSFKDVEMIDRRPGAVSETYGILESLFTACDWGSGNRGYIWELSDFHFNSN